MAKAWLGVVVGALLAFTMAGCGQKGFSERAQEQRAAQDGAGTTFRYPIVTSPTTLDPHRVEDGDTIDLLQQTYEGLVAWSEDSRVAPALATWEEQEGGRAYLFTLKPGAKFHNGREVTAEDVKWSLERATNPKLASPVAGTYLNDIVGVRERLAGEAESIAGVEVVAPNQVRIRIDRPRAYFLGKLTYLVSAVLPKESVPADGEITQPEQMVGTGPFRTVRYEPDLLVVQEAFADYHGGAPKIARIERPVIKDAATRLNKYKAGELDLVMLERQDVAGLQKDPALKDHLKFFDRPAIWYVGFAPNAYPPFRDPRVRRAFAMAIDKQVIVDEILGGVNQVAHTIIPPGVEGHRPEARGLAYDPEAARRLLAEAGFPGGRGLPPLEFNFRERRDVQLVADAVAAQLRQNLGVEANLRMMEWGAYLEKRNRGELQLYHMRWAADYLDPENFLSLLLTTDAPENRSGYSNPQVDALCREADGMPNGPERMAKYAQAEDLLLQDAPWLPVYFQRDAELIRPSVKGLRGSLFGHLPHSTVEIGG